MERTARKETFPSYIGVIVHATFSSSGTVGSKQFGVAKQVSLIAVKVLDHNGRGQWSNMCILMQATPL
jgi:hypothetical protein